MDAIGATWVRLIAGIGSDPVEAWESDVFSRAWAMIMDNIDLVEWAVCTVMGPDQDLSCIEGFLFHRHLWDAVIVLLDPEEGNTECTRPYYWFAPPLGTAFVHSVWPAGPTFNHVNLSFNGVNFQISFCRGNQSHEILETRWNNGGDQATCVAMRLAGVLVHELSHACLYQVNDAGGTTPTFSETQWQAWCLKRRAYMIEGTFFWAMTKRYDLSHLRCCSINDDTFFNHQGMTGQDCAY